MADSTKNTPAQTTPAQTAPLGLTVYNISTLAQLQQAATALAQQAQPGQVWALEGPMGAGKTTFCQAVGKALGLKEPVQSPSYGLIHHYTGGKLPVMHVDLYRLGPEGAAGLLPELDEWLNTGSGLLWVEWASYLPALKPDITHGLKLEMDEPNRLLLLAVGTQTALEEGFFQ